MHLSGEHMSNEFSRSSDQPKFNSVVHLDSSTDIDQAKARQLLQDWHSGAGKLERGHLASSILYGRRAKQSGLFSVVLMMLGLTVSSLAPYLASTATGSSAFAIICVEKIIPWTLASAGVILFFITEGLEYPKRAALHNLAFKEFKGIQTEIETLLIRNTISFREMHQISMSLQKATERMQSVRLRYVE
jgi:hypothetical protein